MILIRSFTGSAPFPSGRPLGKNGDVLTTDTRDRGAYLLQVKGSSALVLNVVPAGQLAEMQEGAWKDLEIDFEPAAIRFESAKFTDQLSLRKR